MDNKTSRMTLRRRTALAMAAAVTASGFAATNANAQVPTNTDTVQTGNWLDPATWSPVQPAASGVPTNAFIGNGHTVTIDNAGPNTLRLDLGGGTGTDKSGHVTMTGGELYVDNFDGILGTPENPPLPSIRVGFGAGNIGTFTQSGGAVTIGGGAGTGFAIGDLILGDQGGTGTWIQTAGDMTATDEAIIGLGATGTATISGGNFQTTGRSILVGFAGGGNGTLNVSGTANVTANHDMLVGFLEGSTATINQSGGTITAGLVFTNFAAGAGSTVNWTQTGGTYNTRIAFVMGHSAGTTTLNHSGGTINAMLGNGDFVVSDGGGNTSTYNISGTAAVNALTNVVLGQFNGANGTINQTGGTITAGGNARVGGDGTGTWNLSAGAANIGNVFLGDFDSSFGTMTITGGTLTLTGNLNVGAAIASNADNVNRVAPDGTNGAQGQAVDANGTLVISGTGGDINVAGNLIANPADKSPVRNGPGQENSATLKFITGATGVSPIDVGLKADLDGAVIDIDDTGGFFTTNPAASLTLITAAGGFGNVYTLTPAEQAGNGEGYSLAPADADSYALEIIPSGGGESLIAKLISSVYWDTNGTTAGAGGATPTGAWNGTATNFNTDAAGGAGTLSAATTAAQKVVFAAGTDGGGTYNVTVSGTQTAASVVVARGNVNFTGGTIAAGSFDVAAGSTSNVSSTLTGSAVGGTLTKKGAGTLTLAAANTHTGGTIAESGTLVLASADALGTGSLAVNNGATVQTQAGLPKAVSVASVTTAGTGKLDLTNNDLVVKNSTVAAVQALLVAGFNTGTWDGPGIQCSAAATDPNGFTTLGYLSNADLGATEFSGVPVDADDVLVKYTYYGDADLSGNVTLDDYSQFLFGFQNPVPASWSVGDFDYSGTVTLDDFSVFLLVFQNQGGPLGGLADAISTDTGLSEGNRAAMLGAIAAVPEPASLGVLALAGMGMLGRRRNRRNA